MHLPLLKTDQLYCYDEAGNVVPCTGQGPAYASGQDAARPGHLPPAGTRFQVRDGVVLDTATGALWSRDANPASFPLTWEEACSFTADMAGRASHGRTDWQLPSRRLLFSLLSHQAVNPALPQGHPFENVFSGYYWSADASHRFPEQAWHVHLGGGRMPRAWKRESALVWPVCPPPRRQNAWDQGAARFAADEIAVRDAATGLIWSRDADLPQGPLSWEGALAWLESFNRRGQGGATDWRLPNIRELESLADLHADSPALTAGHPFRHVREAYWSSTTSVYEARYAWTLYTRDGMVGVGFKASVDFYLWPVRGGR